jgi:hypothetical protein
VATGGSTAAKGSGILAESAAAAANAVQPAHPAKNIPTKRAAIRVGFTGQSGHVAQIQPQDIP